MQNVEAVHDPPIAPTGAVPRQRQNTAFVSRFAEPVLVLAAYTVLTVILTWPIAARLTTALPDGSDGWQYLWDLWWMRTALLELHTNPFHTAYLYHPAGASLYLDTVIPLPGLMGIPLEWLGLNLVGVYNLLTLFSFLGAGGGTYLLVRTLTGSRPAAFVAGIIFAFCPYHYAHMLGQLNLASIQWIPFYVLALCKAWQGWGVGGWSLEQSDQPPTLNLHPQSRAAQLRWAAVAGVLLAANAYTEWTYALFLGLFTLWFVGWQVIRRRGAGWRTSALRLAVLGGVGLALVAPVLAPMIQEARTTSYGQSAIQEVNWLSTDLTDPLVPSPFHPVWQIIGPTLEPHYYYHPRAEWVVFVGYSVLLVSLITSWRLRRQPGVRFWSLTALGAGILSLGPILHIWGERLFFGLPFPIPLPYLALYVLPFFNILRVPARFMVLVMLALAVLVGYGLAAVRAGHWRGLPGRGRLRPITLASLGMAALVIVEYLAIPYPMQARDYQAGFYQDLTAAPAGTAILELPLTPQSIYEAYQTLHGRPIVGGYLSRQPPDPFVAGTPVLRYLLPTTPVDDPVASEAARTGLADLRRARVGYAIVHWWLPYGQEGPDLRAKLARVFAGTPARQLNAEQVTIYQLLP